MEELRGFFKYWFGDIVYLRTDPDQHQRVVIGINVRPNNVVYVLAHGSAPLGEHYEFEISKEVDVVMRTGE